MEYMNQHFEKKIVIIVGLVVLAGGSFLLGQHTRPVSGYSQPALKIDTASISDKDFAPFWKVWNTLEQKYVGATSTPNQEKIYGAMQGLVSSLGMNTLFPILGMAGAAQVGAALALYIKSKL